MQYNYVYRRKTTSLYPACQIRVAEHGHLAPPPPNTHTHTPLPPLPTDCAWTLNTFAPHDPLQAPAFCHPRHYNSTPLFIPKYNGQLISLLIFIYIWNPPMPAACHNPTLVRRDTPLPFFVCRASQFLRSLDRLLAVPLFSTTVPVQRFHLEIPYPLCAS